MSTPAPPEPPGPPGPDAPDDGTAAINWPRLYVIVIASQVVVALLLALLGEVAS